VGHVVTALQLGRAVLVVFAGSVVAWAAFNATATAPDGQLPPLFDASGNLIAHTPPCPTVVEPGFDPWTGQRHGYVLDCSGSSFTVPTAQGWAGRRAVPLPVGFFVGSLGAAGALFLLDRRRRPPDRPVVRSNASSRSDPIDPAP
jgi:hypothetical protein